MPPAVGGAETAAPARSGSTRAASAAIRSGSSSSDGPSRIQSGSATSACSTASACFMASTCRCTPSAESGSRCCPPSTSRTAAATQAARPWLFGGISYSSWPPQETDSGSAQSTSCAAKSCALNAPPASAWATIRAASGPV